MKNHEIPDTSLPLAINPLLKDRHIWGFGLGNFGYGALFQILAYFFVFYATAVLGLSGTVVGLIVGVSVFWDAISDPIMGYLSDFTVNKRFGRRHLYLWIGTITMVGFNLILWNLSSGMPTWALISSLTITLLLIKTATTIYGTPYSALAAELTHDHVQRAKVQSIRMTFFMLGIFFASAISMTVFFRATPEYEIGQLNPLGYRNMSIVTSIILLISGIVAILSTKQLIPTLNKRVVESSNMSVTNFLSQTVNAFKHYDLRVVIIGYLFTNLAAAILNGVGLHVYTYTFAMGSTDVALVAGAQLLIAVCSQPFWLWLNKHQDKVTSIRLGLTMSMIASVYFVFCVVMKDFTVLHLWLLIPFVVLGGVGSGGLFMLPQAMVADAVDENALETGDRQEGVYYGALTLSYKLSQSIAIFCIGIFLDMVGFNGDHPVQSEFTMTTLGIFMGVGTLLSFVGARKSYKHYRITRARLAEIHMGLLQRDHSI